MKKLIGHIVVLAIATATACAAQTNYYFVNVSNSIPSEPYTNWADAATGIQEAVNQAEADLGPGTNCIVLVTNGVYTLTNQIEIGKAITVRSTSGRKATIVDGNYPAFSNRCFYITGNAVLDGFTITNGFAYGSTPGNRGGGIYADTCAARVENCDIMHNRADQPSGAGYGGGMAMVGGATVVLNCLIAANDTMGVSGEGHAGTGIYILNSSGKVIDCVISNNVQGGSNGSGAGVHMSGSVNAMVSNCVMIANQCSRYGANYVYGGTFTHCLFTNNRARSAGGALQLYGSRTGSKLLYSTVVDNECYAGGGGGVSINRGTIHNSTIICNRASGSGGGVANNEGYLKNCLIAGNVAGGDGGGLHRPNKPQNIRNCTIVRNVAGGQGGGIYSSVTNLPAHFLNMIVYFNQAGGVDNDIDSNVANWQDYFVASCSPDLVDGMYSNITDDPLFVDEGKEFGTNAILGNYTLFTKSPCRDVGVNESWMTSDPKTDLAGYPRILPQDGTVNMGAYEQEVPGPLVGTVVVIE